MLACRSNPDQWFLELPLKGKHYKVAEAKVVRKSKEAIETCFLCPARLECEQEGMKEENLEWGIWGGTTPAERLLNSNIQPNEMEIRFMELVT